VSHAESKLSSELPARLTSLGCCWQYPGLASELEVNPSKRLTRSLGLCRPQRAQITLSLALFKPGREALLHETLVHEAAHYVAFQRFGRKIKPHGAQWAQLMITAGFEPRTRIAETDLPWPVALPQRWLYEHVCTDCGQLIVRLHTSKNWRCKHCSDQGLPGILKIMAKQKVLRATSGHPLTWS
jgi:SprT protein